MISPFQELLNHYAASLLIDRKFYDFCCLYRVNFDLWPDSDAKKLAISYKELKNRLGHDKAAVQLSGYLESEHIKTGDFPTDKGILNAYYESLLKEHYAKILAKNITDNPLEAEKYIAKFPQATTTKRLVCLAENIEMFFRETARQCEAKEDTVQIPRWPLLSEAIGGFNPGRVGMFLAQTGFGKTTASVNFALCAADKHKVVYFNMEMLTQDFAEKIMMAELGLTRHQLKKKTHDYIEQMAARMPAIFSKRLKFSEGEALTPEEIFAMCRQEKTTSGLDFIIVDYDQKLLFQTSKDLPEWKALQLAVEQFEALAKELKCFVLILAQESGDGEISGSKRSKFPASTVLRFYKNSAGKFLIQAVKNRFGEHEVCIEVTYEPAKSIVKEKCIYTSTEADGQGLFPRPPQRVGPTRQPFKTFVK